MKVSFLKNPFRCLRVAITGGALAAVSLSLFRRGLCFFSLLIFFWLCASVMSRLALDIILLQRLGVIGIILKLIYSPLLKKNGYSFVLALPSQSVFCGATFTMRDPSQTVHYYRMCMISIQSHTFARPKLYAVTN